MDYAADKGRGSDRPGGRQGGGDRHGRQVGGPVVAIEDASGRVWRVCGTTDAKVKKGDTVSAGQTIGKVGSVSCECAEESHIHLEVMEGEKYLDPIKAMKQAKFSGQVQQNAVPAFFTLLLEVDSGMIN